MRKYNMANSILSQLKSKGSFSKLLEEVNKIATPDSKVKSYVDEREWKLTIGKDGNGSALIRFLPCPDEGQLPFVKIFRYAFSYLNGEIQPQGSKTGKWFIENSLSTLGQTDYVYEANKQLWETGVESNKEIARKRKRTLNYYSNILVINDPEHSENNGKVFLFKYGKSIMDHIAKAMNPVVADDFDDEKPEAFDPFNPYFGADFALRIARIKGWPSYENSSFKKPKPMLKGDDEAIEKAFAATYSLQELLDPSHFKSYDELKKRFLEVTSSASIGNAAETDIVTFMDSDEDVPVFSAPEIKKKPVVQSLVEDDDEDLSFFEKLSKEE